MKASGWSERRERGLDCNAKAVCKAPEALLPWEGILSQWHMTDG